MVATKPNDGSNRLTVRAPMGSSKRSKKPPPAKKSTGATSGTIMVTRKKVGASGAPSTNTYIKKVGPSGRSARNKNWGRHPDLVAAEMAALQGYDPFCVAHADEHEAYREVDIQDHARSATWGERVCAAVGTAVVRVAGGGALDLLATAVTLRSMARRTNPLLAVGAALFLLHLLVLVLVLLPWAPYGQAKGILGALGSARGGQRGNRKRCGGRRRVCCCCGAGRHRKVLVAAYGAAPTQATAAALGWRGRWRAAASRAAHAACILGAALYLELRLVSTWLVASQAVSDKERSLWEAGVATANRGREKELAFLAAGGAAGAAARGADGVLRDRVTRRRVSEPWLAKRWFRTARQRVYNKVAAAAWRATAPLPVRADDFERRSRAARLLLAAPRVALAVLLIKQHTQLPSKLDYVAPPTPFPTPAPSPPTPAPLPPPVFVSPGAGLRKDINIVNLGNMGDIPCFLGEPATDVRYDCMRRYWVDGSGNYEPFELAPGGPPKCLSCCAENGTAVIEQVGNAASRYAPCWPPGYSRNTCCRAYHVWGNEGAARPALSPPSFARSDICWGAAPTVGAASAELPWGHPAAPAGTMMKAVANGTLVGKGRAWTGRVDPSTGKAMRPMCSGFNYGSIGFVTPFAESGCLSCCDEYTFGPSGNPACWQVPMAGGQWNAASCCKKLAIMSAPPTPFPTPWANTVLQAKQRASQLAADEVQAAAAMVVSDREREAAEKVSFRVIYQAFLEAPTPLPCPAHRPCIDVPAAVLGGLVALFMLLWALRQRRMRGQSKRLLKAAAFTFSQPMWRFARWVRWQVLGIASALVYHTRAKARACRKWRRHRAARINPTGSVAMALRVEAMEAAAVLVAEQQQKAAASAAAATAAATARQQARTGAVISGPVASIDHVKEHIDVGMLERMGDDCARRGREVGNEARHRNHRAFGGSNNGATLATDGGNEDEEPFRVAVLKLRVQHCVLGAHGYKYSTGELQRDVAPGRHHPMSAKPDVNIATRARSQAIAAFSRCVASLGPQRLPPLLELDWSPWLLHLDLRGTALGGAGKRRLAGALLAGRVHSNHHAAHATKTGAAKGGASGGTKSGDGEGMQARVRLYSFLCDEWGIEPNTAHFHLAASARRARYAAAQKAKKGNREPANFHAEGAPDVVLLPDVLLALGVLAHYVGGDVLTVDLSGTALCGVYPVQRKAPPPPQNAAQKVAAAQKAKAAKKGNAAAGKKKAHDDDSSDDGTSGGADPVSTAAQSAPTAAESDVIGDSDAKSVDVGAAESDAVSAGADFVLAGQLELTALHCLSAVLGAGCVEPRGASSNRRPFPAPARRKGLPMLERLSLAGVGLCGVVGLRTGTASGGKGGEYDGDGCGNGFGGGGGPVRGKHCSEGVTALCDALAGAARRGGLRLRRGLDLRGNELWADGAKALAIGLQVVAEAAAKGIRDAANCATTPAGAGSGRPPGTCVRSLSLGYNRLSRGERRRGRSAEPMGGFTDFDFFPAIDGVVALAATLAATTRVAVAERDESEDEEEELAKEAVAKAAADLANGKLAGGGTDGDGEMSLAATSAAIKSSSATANPTRRRPRTPPKQLAPMDALGLRRIELPSNQLCCRVFNDSEAVARGAGTARGAGAGGLIASDRVLAQRHDGEYEWTGALSTEGVAALGRAVRALGRAAAAEDESAGAGMGGADDTDSNSDSDAEQPMPRSHSLPGVLLGGRAFAACSRHLLAMQSACSGHSFAAAAVGLDLSDNALGDRGVRALLAALEDYRTERHGVKVTAEELGEDGEKLLTPQELAAAAAARYTVQREEQSVAEAERSGRGGHGGAETDSSGDESGFFDPPPPVTSGATTKSLGSTAAAKSAAQALRGKAVWRFGGNRGAGAAEVLPPVSLSLELQCNGIGKRGGSAIGQFLRTSPCARRHRRSRSARKPHKKSAVEAAAEAPPLSLRVLDVSCNFIGAHALEEMCQPLEGAEAATSESGLRAAARLWGLRRPSLAALCLGGNPLSGGHGDHLSALSALAQSLTAPRKLPRPMSAAAAAAAVRRAARVSAVSGTGSGGDLLHLEDVEENEAPVEQISPISCLEALSLSGVPLSRTWQGDHWRGEARVLRLLAHAVTACCMDARDAGLAGYGRKTWLQALDLRGCDVLGCELRPAPAVPDATGGHSLLARVVFKTPVSENAVAVRQVKAMGLDPSLARVWGGIGKGVAGIAHKDSLSALCALASALGVHAKVAHGKRVRQAERQGICAAVERAPAWLLVTENAISKVVMIEVKTHCKGQAQTAVQSGGGSGAQGARSRWLGGAQGNKLGDHGAWVRLDLDAMMDNDA